MPVLQHRVGLALRSRVAGDDAPEVAKRIWGAEGERWFTPADPIWRVNENAAMFPGGLAALLLQSLHPSAMAGVAGHSGYKGDPWGRLQRTSHYLAVTTFGTVDFSTSAPAAAAAERSDVTAVPALGVIAEAMVCFIVAQAMLEKFGGDSVAETKRNHDAYIAHIGKRIHERVE